MHVAPGDLIPVHLTPAHFGDMRKALGERTVHQTKNRTRRKGSDRSFHHARSRRCGYEHRTLRQKYALQSVLKPPEQLLELGAAVRDHRLEHGGQYFGTNFGGTGKKKSPEAGVSRHAPT